MDRLLLNLGMLIFILAASWHFWLNHFHQRASSHAAWRQVPGRVRQARVSEGKTSEGSVYTAGVVYDYIVDGERRQGFHYAGRSLTYPLRASAQEALAPFAVDAVVTVALDPEDAGKSELVIADDARLRRFLLPARVLQALGLVLITVGLLAGLVR